MTTKQKIMAIIEARMTSERLPGKVLLPACGKPLLAHQIERLKRVKNLDGIVVATTINKADDPIEDLAKIMGIYCFRGSEEDVLGRVLGAAQTNKVGIIVELTGDCPAIDPIVIQEGIEQFLNSDVDYIENTGFPGGMNYAIFRTKTLSEVEKETRNDLAAREHVSLPIYENPKRYRIKRITPSKKFCRPEIFVELDEEDDYKFIKTIFEALYPKNPMFGLSEILTYLDQNPKVIQINEHVRRKTARV